MKFGRYEIDINDKDLILDNGACYQIITRDIGAGWNSYAPKISKKLFKELKSCGAVFTNDQLKDEASKKYKVQDVTYWKFNMDIANEFTYTGQLKIGKPIYKHIQSGLVGFTMPILIGSVISVNDGIAILEKDNIQTKYKIVKRNDTYTGATLYSLDEIQV